MLSLRYSCQLERAFTRDAASAHVAEPSDEEHVNPKIESRAGAQRQAETAVDNDTGAIAKIW